MGFVTRNSAAAYVVGACATLYAGPGRAEASKAETHCGIWLGQIPRVNMWEVEPPSDRKTTRELIVSIVQGHHFYRACKENGFTVVIKMASRRRNLEAVYFVKD